MEEALSDFTGGTSPMLLAITTMLSILMGHVQDKAALARDIDDVINSVDDQFNHDTDHGKFVAILVKFRQNLNP